MLSLRKTVSGVLLSLMTLTAACSTASDPSGSETQTATSGSPNVFSPNGTLITPGAVSLNNWLCVAVRPDKEHEGKTFIQFGKNSSEACTKAISLCAQITGGSSGAVIGSGAGACVAKSFYDTKFRAAGTTLGNSQGWACTVTERTNTGRGRTFPGVGASRMDAYADAKKLCDSKAGVKCSMDPICTDLSNGRITKN